MVRIEGGTFTMGCQGGFFSACDADEKPAHPVTVHSFEVSKYEVTQEVWAAVMEREPEPLPGLSPMSSRASQLG